MTRIIVNLEVVVLSFIVFVIQTYTFHRNFLCVLLVQSSLNLQGSCQNLSLLLQEITSG